MRKLAIVFLSATLLTSSSFADKSQVVATYTGGDVTSAQIMEQFKPMLESQEEHKGKKFSELDKNLQEAIVKGYINQKLFEKEVEKLGIRNSEEFKKKVTAAEAQLLQQEFVEGYLKTAVTDKIVDAEYLTMIDKLKGQKEVKVSHILVDTEEKAKEIKKKLDKGSKFETLVTECSKCEGSKSNGGELGYVLKGQLVPEFESKAFSMKKDEISDPVKTQFGWHIIRVLDFRDVKIPSREEADSNIRSQLSREAMESYFAKLSDQANIQLKL